MTAGVPSVAARIYRRRRELPQSSPSLHASLPELLQPLRGVMQPFPGLPQRLRGVYQSLKEAHQPLQEAQNQTFGINQPKKDIFHPKPAVRRQAAKSGIFLRLGSAISQLRRVPRRFSKSGTGHEGRGINGRGMANIPLPFIPLPRPSWKTHGCSALIALRRYLVAALIFTF